MEGSKLGAVEERTLMKFGEKRRGISGNKEFVRSFARILAESDGKERESEWMIFLTFELRRERDI